MTGYISRPACPDCNGSGFTVTTIRASTSDGTAVPVTTRNICTRCAGYGTTETAATS